MLEIKSDSWRDLSDDAYSEVCRYFLQAVKDIDKKFGEGYAKANPTLVAAFMQASADMFNGSTVGVCLQQIAEKKMSIAAGLDNISTSIDNYSS